MVEFIKTLLIACIPSVIAGVGTYLVAKKNAASQIEIVKEQNKHDLDRLMKQHQIDIDNLKESHLLEMDRIEQTHKFNLEIKEKEFENNLLRQQKEGETVVAAETLKGVFNLVGNALTTKEGQQILGDAAKKQSKDK